MQLGIRDVAALFEVADKTVYRWVEEDGLPAHEVEGQHRFHRAEVLEWATTRDLSPSPELFGEPGASSISDALRRGGIFYDVPAQDRRAAISAMLERLRGVHDHDRAVLADVLLARRGFGKPSGPHLAIPHVRHPIVLDVTDPALTLFFFATPVDLDEGEGPSAGLVHAAFTLISPSVRSHLVVLSRLSYLVHDESVRAMLERRAPADEIHAVFASRATG